MKEEKTKPSQTSNVHVYYEMTKMLLQANADGIYFFFIRTRAQFFSKFKSKLRTIPASVRKNNLRTRANMQHICK